MNKTTSDDLDEETKSSLEQGDQDVDEETEQDALIASNRQLARIAGYSAVVSILAVVLLAWFANSRLIALETKLSETSAETFKQMNGRLIALETLRPKPELPKFVEFTPPPDAPRQGVVTAPVSIVGFADFQCPFCGRFHTDTYPLLKAEYIDTGKASFVYQDFAFLGEESILAGQAAKCAAEQDKFWQYHDYLYTHQDGENKGAFSAKNLKTFAKPVGLKQAAFNACLDSGKYAAKVEAETAAGKALGISGTPTLIVNGQLLVGALPFEAFKKIIDGELAK